MKSAVQMNCSHFSTYKHKAGKQCRLVEKDSFHSVCCLFWEVRTFTYCAVGGRFIYLLVDNSRHFSYKHCLRKSRPQYRYQKQSTIINLSCQHLQVDRLWHPTLLVALEKLEIVAFRHTWEKRGMLGIFYPPFFWIFRQI